MADPARAATHPRTYPGRYVWLIVLVGGIVASEATRRVLVATDNLQLMPTVMVVGASVVPAAFVVFIRSRRIRFTVPGGSLGVVAVCGGVIGVTIAGLVEYDTLRHAGFSTIVGVAAIEEAAKLVVPVVVLRRWVNPADGLAIGVAAGAGFAALETMGYAFTTLVAHQGSISSIDGVLVMRGFLSPAGHMAWTGIATAALWWAARKRSPRAIAGCVATLVVAVALHTAWDAIGTPIGYAVIASTGLAALTWAARHAAALDGEVSDGEDLGTV